MNLSSPATRALNRLAALLGSPTAIVNLTEVSVVPSTATRGTVLEVGGQAQDIAIVLTIPCDELESAPVAGSTAVHGGICYRILRVRKTADGAAYVIECGSPHGA
jgi:hypothetical protein